MRRTRWVLAVVIGAMALSACGDDDGGEAGADEGTSEAASGDDTGELSLGDPCELVTADDVAAVAGFAVTAELVNVDDGLPGATCTYTGDGGEGLINLSITPEGADAFATSASSDLAVGGPDLGDDSYVVEGGEIGVLVGDAWLTVNVFVGELSLEVEGAEIAELAAAAL